MNSKTLPLRAALKTDLLDPFATDFEDVFEDDLDTTVIRIYEGDTVLDGSLDLYDLFEQRVAGIIVNGNLTVHGSIIDFELDTVSAFLQVHGSLTCQRLAAGVAEILVSGDVQVADVLVAFYNHGRIEIAGNVNGRLLIVDDHGIEIKGKINAATYCRGWHIPGADFTDWRDILLPEVAAELIGEDNYLFAGDVRFLKMLQEGNPVFKPVFDTPAPVPQVVGYDFIKPLVQHLPCEYEAHPLAIAETLEELPELKFLYYDGHTTLDAIDLDDPNYFAIVVNGNLTVTGNIMNEETDGACSLIVLGNLKAKNVVVGGQLLYITGYVKVEEVLMGIYNHGEFYSQGYVWCPAIIADDYHFHFSDYAGVKALDFSDEDDLDIIKELLIDDYIDEDGEGYIVYSLLKEGRSLLRPQQVRTEITKADLARLINVSLFGPDHMQLVLSEDGWHITLDRGGYQDEEGDTVPSSVIAINIDKNKYFMWYLVPDDTIGVLIKDHDDEWVAATDKQQGEVLQTFSKIETYIDRKVRWNDKLVKEVDKENLWKLVWMFRDGSEDAEFQVIAVAICQRVLYAAAHPYAYIFTRYPEESKHRGLADTPYWAVAAALLDGLLYAELIQEIDRSTPLSTNGAALNAVTELNWGFPIELAGRMETDPIDKPFMCELNEMLLEREGALLRLDVGIKPYILAGVHINDIDVLNQLIQPFGIFPKYFRFVYEEDETELKKVADDLLNAAKNNDMVGLQAGRAYQDQLWEWVYNERGSAAYWQEWIDDLKSWLATKAGSSYTFRGDDLFDPLHPEVESWIDWCERYEKVKEECNIEV